jgi:hypothetical protein
MPYSIDPYKWLKPKYRAEFEEDPFYEMWVVWKAFDTRKRKWNYVFVRLPVWSLNWAKNFTLSAWIWEDNFKDKDDFFSDNELFSAWNDTDVNEFSFRIKKKLWKYYLYLRFKWKEEEFETDKLVNFYSNPYRAYHTWKYITLVKRWWEFLIYINWELIKTLTWFSEEKINVKPWQFLLWFNQMIDFNNSFRTRNFNW